MVTVSSETETDLQRCPEPQEQPHASRSGAVSPYAIGDEVHFICDPCYSGGGTQTCLEDGTWSEVPACKSNTFFRV